MGVGEVYVEIKQLVMEGELKKYTFLKYLFQGLLRHAL
jgi:hypothetical protein